MDAIKIWIRDFLRGLAENFDPDRRRNGPVIRDAKAFFHTEIKIPIVLSVIITFIVIYFMILTQLGYTYGNAIATGLIVFAVAYIFISEVRKEESLASDSDAVVLICFMLVIAVLVMQVCQYYLEIFSFPIGAFVVMSVMLLRPRMGLSFAIVLSLFGAVSSNMSFDVFAILFAGGMVVLSPARKIRSRGGFVSTSLILTITNILTATTFYLFNYYSFTQYQQIVYLVSLNGAFMLIMLLVLTPIFERVFSRATSIKLIELGDFNNKLLQDLVGKAPGTYHHSIMTALIAERAAQAIGVDPILARVASYYHDIGKINNPEYFSENQIHGYNAHNKCSIAMSVLILNSHIKDGTALAKKQNIDKDIIDIIEQHHGTTVMASFYNKACEEQGVDTVNENDFRYPGPKPQTKIAAIIMIADSCEAACRSIDEPTDSDISEMVDKIVEGKMKDEQFSECPITFKELDIIKETVKNAIIAQHHPRQKYEKNGEDKEEHEAE
jgi:putative nucleotidyltransferase with HDIG domain